MPRDAKVTRAALLRAATLEFAEHGIAGARVDRIAAAAGYNKNLLYIHFGSKDRLFDAVFSEAVTEILDAAPFTADDLPGYARRLFDFHISHPHLMRLARWHSLERGVSNDYVPLVAQANGRKLAALEQSQLDGSVDSTLPARLLLPLIVSIACTWSQGSAEPVTQCGDAGEIAARRAAAVAAVDRLVRPRD